MPSDNPPYSSWLLTKRIIIVAGLETALYLPDEIDPNKETVLMMHGMTGDRHGLMPLGYDLRREYNVCLIDLPGHGQTATPDTTGYIFWQQWSQGLLPAIQAAGITIDQIIGHSAGCLVATMTQVKDVRMTLITPVLKPSELYSRYTRFIYYFRHILIPLFRIRWLAYLRGRMLVYKKTPEALRAVRWITKTEKFVPSQFLYQVTVGRHVGNPVLSHDFYNVRFRSMLIIYALQDTLPHVDVQDMRQRLPYAKIIETPGSHMLPIEDHSHIAQLIIDNNKSK